MKKTIDARGLMCPRPLIMTKQELRQMEPGSLTVLVDNGVAADNIESFAATEGLVSQRERQGDDFAITIHKQAVSAVATDFGGAVVMISSDQFGTGDLEFSETLMRNFIFALTEAEPRPATILFVNSGAFFSCEGSPVLDSLNLLAAAGVELLTCGACLDFYQLKDKLAVGSVTNMYVIAEKLLRAANVIKP